MRKMGAKAQCASEGKSLTLTNCSLLAPDSYTINHITIVSEVVEQHSTQRHQTENHLRTFSEEVILKTDFMLAD